MGLNRRHLLALLLLAACGKGDTRPRCNECGMYADEVPAFAAGATTTEGAALRFDAPRCLFRYLVRRGLGAGSDPWVTEHYALERRSIDAVVYVIGSDVTGPMGPDLVPLDRSHLAQFTADHGGRVVERAAIDDALLRSLDP